MIPVKHIDPDDLPLYAMHLLPPDEMEEMSLHLQHSAEARRVLSEILGDLSLFAFTADMHSPPALTRQRLMKHVAREKKAIPIDINRQSAAEYTPRTSPLLDDEPARRSAAARVLPWIGWAAAAGLAVASAGLYSQREHLKQDVASQHVQLATTQAALDNAKVIMDTVQDPSAVRVSLTPTGVAPPPEGRAIHVADKGTLVFIASNLEPLQTYKTYELWLIPADGRDAIPAGTFHPDAHGNAQVLLPALPKGVQAKAFGVTVEDGEGASSPTMPIILKGAVAS